MLGVVFAFVLVLANGDSRMSEPFASRGACEAGRLAFDDARSADILFLSRADFVRTSECFVLTHGPPPELPTRAE